MIVGFSGFGFPKAHGAAFGLLAYQSTWLRVHYGPEFLCSLLDEQPMGFYPPDALVHEAQRRGIEVLAARRQRQRGRLHRHVPTAPCGSVLPLRARRPGATSRRARRRAATRIGPCRSPGALARAGRGGARRRPPRARLRPRRARRRGRRARRRPRGRRPVPLARRPRRARGRRAPGAGPAGVVGRLRRPGRRPPARRCGAWASPRPPHAAGRGARSSRSPLELPAAPALRAARRLGRDDRRLRDDRPDRRPPSRCASCARA